MRRRSAPTPISSSICADVLDAALGPQVAFEEVAAAFQAARPPGRRRSPSRRPPGCAPSRSCRCRAVDDADVGRILHAPRARQVGGRVGAEVAAEGDDLRLPRRRAGAAGGRLTAAVMTPPSAPAARPAWRPLRVFLVLQRDRSGPGTRRRSFRSPCTWPPGSRPSSGR